MSWLDRWLRKSPTPAEYSQFETGLREFEERIGYEFRDKSLLIRALRHRSYLYHGSEPCSKELASQANERLEFLGDAVLGLATTHYLFNNYPDQPEGELTKRKSVLVSKSVLARRAIAIGLDNCLLLSDMEDSAGGRRRRSILGDGFEALLGAIYLDGGMEPVERFLIQELFNHTHELTHDATYTNYKSLLLEYVQAEGSPPPEYRLRSQEGPDHQKVFTVDALVGEEVLGHGQGRSKKDAQQSAAKEAYERLTGTLIEDNGDDSEPAHDVNNEDR